MTRRSGVTLVEVLVAIFIMGIGLLALLTLFPIGMLRMAQAIRDARSAQSGNNAHKLAIVQDIRNDPVVNTQPLDPYFNNANNNDLFQNPCPILAGAPLLPNALDYGESYSILVDPIGWGASASGGPRNWVGGLPGFLRRRSVAFTNGVTTDVYRNFTLPDDINFYSDMSAGPPGTPQIAGLSAVLRDTRFSWAYHFRRPLTNDKSVVDCTVIVFDQRSLSLTGALQLEEYVYSGQLGQTNPTYFNPTNNTISVDYTNNVPPPLRIGDWIYDATLGINNPGVTPCAAHGYFYRVVSIEDGFVVAGRTIVRYEVQNPLRGFRDPSVVAMTGPMLPDGSSAVGSSAGYVGTSIVIRGIAEVFEKGPVRIP